MTVMLPVGRACTRQFVSRSNHLLTRFASSNPLLRVSNHNSDNPTSSQSCYLSIDKKILLASLRTYATEAAAKPRGRPKAHTGRTVAKGSSTKTKAAAAKKTPAKKTKPKSKPKPKPKTKAKSVSKAKARKTAVKKPLSKHAVNRARIDKTKSLKTAALLGQEPKQLPSTAWMLYFVQAQKGITSANIQEGAAHTKEIAERYKHVSPEELEQLNHTANQNKAKNDVEYKKWVAQYTPLEIKNANAARRRLSQEEKTAGRRQVAIPQIKDDRLVKGPRSSFNTFTRERYASGDFKHMALTEASRLIGREWKALSPEEKKPYNDQAQADLNRYREEVGSVYQKAVATPRRSSKA